MTPAKKTTTTKKTTARKATTKKPPIPDDDSEEQRRDSDREIPIRRYVLEDVIGLVLAKAEDRRGVTKTIEEIRKAIARAEAES